MVSDRPPPSGGPQGGCGRVHSDPGAALIWSIPALPLGHQMAENRDPMPPHCQPFGGPEVEQ